MKRSWPEKGTPPLKALTTLLAMDTLRPRLDLVAFALAFAMLAWPAIGFVAERNGAAAIMCAMCLGGLVAGRMVGVPGRVLLPVAFGLTVVLWLIWIDSPVGPHKTSALAHAIGGTLAGWALVEVLRHRSRDLLAVALLALSAVIALAVVWELGEYVGDRLLDTSLQPSKRDSAEDILLGTAGGLAGITFGTLVALWRRTG
jgi:hypothetical protein